MTMFKISPKHPSFEKLYNIQTTIAAYLNPHMFPFDEFSEWSEEDRLSAIWELEQEFLREISSITN